MNRLAEPASLAPPKWNTAIAVVLTYPHPIYPPETLASRPQ